MGIALRKLRGKTSDELSMGRVWKIVAAPNAKNKNLYVTLARFQGAQVYPEAARRRRRVCANINRSNRINEPEATCTTRFFWQHTARTTQLVGSKCGAAPTQHPD